MISPERSHELLSAYAATRCGSAFRELMAGWSGMVYATALRVARGQESLAEDVTQAVFARLAAAPEKVRDARALGGWLHAAATGLTLDALRLEARRRRREEISQHLIVHTREPPAPDAGAGHHELTTEIDEALSKLPPQDSQILLMRFWQQHDWRCIGRNFGLSDDAAQKRMNRALERLRRILARRGITSPTGILSAVLAGTIPRDLPAATALKIISATHIPTAAGAASTVLTSVVMTTKTKVVIAASAFLLVAAAPFFYQQQRIAALEGELQSLHQTAIVPAEKQAPVTGFAQERSSVHAFPPKPKDLPGFPSPEGSSIPGPKRDNAGPIDYDALISGQVKEKLAALRNRLSLTPAQEIKIAQALEYGQAKTKVLHNDTKVIRATVDDKMKMENAISASLTADQQQEYESFRAEERANAAEAVANRELSKLQSMTTLSHEQKDQAFAAFSEMASRESMQDLPVPGADPEAMRKAVEARWADRQEALGRILTPEQMAIYQQAGNPFAGGSGG